MVLIKNFSNFHVFFIKNFKLKITKKKNEKQFFIFPAYIHAMIYPHMSTPRYMENQEEDVCMCVRYLLDGLTYIRI